jgi:hypothetical protein
MTYDTPQALRIALEQRLLNRSRASKVSLDRLRRRVVFERVVARLQAAEPGQWVLKGGMALEVRLQDAARLTKDIDLGLRAEDVEPTGLHDRLVQALGRDPYADRFVLRAGPVARLMEDGGGTVTLRSGIAADLAGKPFGRVQLDISPRGHELEQTDVVPLPNSLAFAGIDTPTIEIVDLHRHAAEKYHAMLKDFGERENSRVRDLVDLVILCEHDQLDPTRLRDFVARVWREREDADPPPHLPALPLSWPERYERTAHDHDLSTTSFAAAVWTVSALWTAMFTTSKES